MYVLRDSAKWSYAFAFQINEIVWALLPKDMQDMYFKLPLWEDI